MKTRILILCIIIFSNFLYAQEEVKTKDDRTIIINADGTWKYKKGNSFNNSFTDSRDGRSYKSVTIGAQTWMAENLNAGTMIQVNQNSGNNSKIEKYCYDNKFENCDKYGGLYQWNEAMLYSTTTGTQGICPDGWHIPTYTELQTLGTTVNNNNNALKAIGQGTENGSGTNTSGFSALLAGYHHNDNSFTSIGYGTNFWSSTEDNNNDSYNMFLFYEGNNIDFYANNKDLGFSVRCLKD